MDDIETEFFCVNDEEFAMAIQATASLVVLPYGMEEWTRKYPDSVRNDKETPNV